MGISIEELSGLKRVCTAVYSNAEVESLLDKKVLDFKKNARIPGFSRPGKINEKLVKQKYGKQLHQEVISELMERGWKESLEQYQLKPAYQPTADLKSFEKGSDLVISYSFEAEPSFDLIDVKDLKGDFVRYVVSDALLAPYQEKLAKQFGTKQDLSCAVGAGHLVGVDVVEVIDGTPSPVRQQSILMDDKLQEVNPAIYAALLGMNIGDKKTVDVPHAGKNIPTTFSVETVSAIISATQEELALRLFGKDGVSQEDFNKRLLDMLGLQASEASFEENKEVLLEKLMASYSFDVPEGLVEQQEHECTEEGHKNVKASIRMGFVLSQYFLKYQTKVSQSDVETYLNKQVAMFGIPKDLLLKYLTQNKAFMHNLQNDLMINAFVKDALAMLTDSVTEKPLVI